VFGYFLKHLAKLLEFTLEKRKIPYVFEKKNDNFQEKKKKNPPASSHANMDAG
jgi:hypothetical protein